MLRQLVAVATLVAGISAAGAADYRGAAMCGVMGRSPILDLPSVGDMNAEVSRRLDISIQVASMPRTIDSTSTRFVWASETKAACGIAVGYFAGGEVNDEFVSKCDCFYRRMQGMPTR
jgi:hypothetical protein